MSKWRTPVLRSIGVAALAAFLTSIAGAQSPGHGRPQVSPQSPDAHRSHNCSLGTIAGKWVVITDVLHSQEGFVEGATVGTMNFPGDGTLDGVYDREGADGFHPGIAYAGTVSVNPDCTGTMEWSDSGSSLTLKASFNIGDDGQVIHGMFQDPTLIVGTFRAKRTGVHRCSMETITGTFASASDLLYQLSGALDGYAIGTIDIHKDASTSQVLDLESPSGFQSGLTAVGTVTLNPNCTGTASFHLVGDTQMIGQSFVVADGGREIWSMFQDPTIEVGTSRGIRIRDHNDHDHH